MTRRTRRVIRFTFALVGAWTVALFLIAEVFRPDDQVFAAAQAAGLVPSDSMFWRLARALVGGLVAGLSASFLELRILPLRARRFGVGSMLLLRTVLYSGVAGLSLVAATRFIARQELNIPLAELVTSEGFQSVMRGPTLGQYVLAVVMASFLINTIVQVNRLLGPGTARQILLGRYLRPVEEERAFLFIDLSDSTGIAERLGPLRFADLKNDFFHDVAEPVLDTGGQIVQYVGDEVMITWPMTDKLGASESIRCFFLLDTQVKQRAEEYQGRYGLVPDFKAGLHGGLVVVSQLGDVKREIVFSGDPVNAAARIQGLCRDLGVRFLVSEEMLDQVELPLGVASEVFGEHRLRGRSASVRLVGLSASPPAEHALGQDHRGDA